MDNRISRRKFLQAGAGGLAALATSGLESRAAGGSSEPVEAIVIGSGFGGAIAALHLGQAGVQTLVIERGKRWTIPDQDNQDVFSTVRNPDGRSTWLSPFTVIGDHKPIDIYTGVLDVAIGNNVIVSRGAGVGGGSLCYAGITYKPSRSVFNRVFNYTLDYDELNDIYYPRVAARLNHPKPIPPDILATDWYKSVRYFLQEGQWVGEKTYLVHQNIDWDIVRMEIAGTRVPSAITGEFWYGNNSGCKNTLDKNYLAWAEATGFVDILPLHVVQGVHAGPGDLYTVRTTEIDTNGMVLAHHTFTCKYLFLAAGSVGTPELLVKAKAKGALPKLNKWVGQLWGNNGDTIYLQVPLSYAAAGNPTLGGPAGGAIEDRHDPNNPITLEALAQFESPVNPSTDLSSMFFLAMGTPPPKGYFAFDKSTNSVQLTWPVGDPEIQAYLQAVINSYNRVNTALNKNGVGVPPVTLSSLETFLCAHPMGGAVMGKACDMYGRVHGYNHLYVVDGSLIPGSAACTNPTFTIAAIAERCMDNVISDIV